MSALAPLLALLVSTALVGIGGDVARTLTTYQTEALEAADRSTFVRVRIEDPDGVMVDVTDLDGYDFLDSVMIRADMDHPVSVAEVKLVREIDGQSISPLMEGSTLNRDSGGSYAPLVNPARAIEIDAAVMKPGDTPDSGDYKLIWEGYIDDPSFGGLRSIITLNARDPIARLNDTYIENVSTYGGGSPLTAIEDVMQQILDDHMGSGEFPLWVVGDPDFGIEEYPLGRVTVLEALKALADLQGWNLHWMWQESPAAFRLTYYEPDRDRPTASGYAADWTFGPDDYYDLPGLRLAQAGIRNKGEVIYRDASGAEQTVSDTRSSSVALYGTRFIRIDERQSRSITALAQATALLTAILDDTEDPVAQQRMDAPFHWPIELGDMHDYESNAVHYDVTQSFAVFGFTHILTSNRMRTLVEASGKPSGGYARWHDRARRNQRTDVRTGNRAANAVPPALEVTFDQNGQAVVSANHPTAETIYVTVGDGSAPSDPTPESNDGEITGTAGTVSTSVKITTGNVAYVKAMAADADGLFSDVGSVQHARRLGSFHKDATDRNHTGDTSPTNLESITVAAGVLGDNGTLRLDIAGYCLGTTNTKTLTILFGGSTVLTYAFAASFQATFHAYVLISNDGSDSSQVTSAFVLPTATLVQHNSATPSIDTSVPVSLVIRATLANAADTLGVVFTNAILEGTD